MRTVNIMKLINYIKSDWCRIVTVFYFVIILILVGFIFFESFIKPASASGQSIVHKEEVIIEVNDIPYAEEAEEEIVEEYVEESYYEEVEPNYNYSNPNYEREYIQKSWEENGDGLTASKGVNYHNGRKETFYSSNVLYHYRTPEWTVDEYGVYRDSDGYVVVAASDLDQGSEVDTSFGKGKVYDSGCSAGITDIYTNW